MNSTELTLAFKQWVFSKDQKILDGFDLAIYPKGEKPPQAQKADINSPTVRLLLESFYKVLYSPPFPRQIQLLRSTAHQLAKRFKEDVFIFRLKEIYETTGGLGFPLPVVESIVFRDVFTHIPLNYSKAYNYGFKRKPVKLGEMILALGDIQDEICDIFEQIIEKNDIPLSFSLHLQEDDTFKV